MKQDTMTLPEYRYQCKDMSLLLAPFKKWIVAPLMRFIPWGLPANMITMISNLFLYAALYISFVHTSGNRYDFLFVALLIFLYAVGDHLDGMQAKRTSTSSALGEFCDHYLDVFNNGILLMIFVNMYALSHLYLIILFFILFYVGHASVLYEEYKTGWLIFEKFGSLEALFLAILFIAASYFQPVYTFFVMPVFKHITFFEILLLVSALGSIGTLIRVGFRIGTFSFNFYLFLMSLLVIAFYAMFFLNKNYIFLVYTLYSSVYMGSLMKGHLVTKKEYYPDFLLLAGMLLHIVMRHTSNIRVHLELGMVAYLSLVILYIVITTFYPLRKYWLWKNPSPKK